MLNEPELAPIPFDRSDDGATQGALRIGASGAHSSEGDGSFGVKGNSFEGVEALGESLPHRGMTAHVLSCDGRAQTVEPRQNGGTDQPGKRANSRSRNTYGSLARWAP